MELVLDFIEVMGQLRRKHKRCMALLLGDIEDRLDKDSEEFQIVRKLILDYSNDYLRASAVVIFGEEIEGLI